MKTNLLLIFVFSLIAIIISQNSSLNADPQLFIQFQNFMKAYNRTYNSSAEFDFRFEIFKDNFKKLQNIIDQKEMNNSLGVTSFFDLTPQEFQKQFLNLEINLIDLIDAQKEENSLKQTLDSDISLKSRGNCTEASNLLKSIPTSLDWRTRGAVGPVRNQGSCGCCWAFSAASNVQSRHFLKYGVLETFSEQQLLDCDNNNYGCNGGLMKDAFLYYMNNGGAVRASDYPYFAFKRPTCSANSFNRITQLTGYTFAGTTDEDYIAQMVATYGPLAVAMNANYLQYYYGGIMNLSAAQCNPFGLNHAVNIVGYGEENGIKFWIVRNSWGSRWGENGYFRIARGNGTCGINRYVITSFVR
jgi:cathepsin F